MAKITPLFHGIVSTKFCHLYLCVYKKSGDARYFGMSSFPKNVEVPPSLDDEKDLQICRKHIADFDAVELRPFDPQTSPVKGCTVKSYDSTNYQTLVVSEASKDGKSVGWWVSSMDEDDQPESCVPLVSVSPPADEKAEKAWVNACQKYDMKLG